MELYRINPSAAHVKELLLGVGGWVGGSACGSGQLAGFEVGGGHVLDFKWSKLDTAQLQPDLK